MLLNMEKSGNSLFIRIPSGAFGEADKTKRIEAVFYEGSVLLHPWKEQPRRGWAKAMAAMHKRAEDRLLVGSD
ncbi:MAG: hypothetical protein WCL50_02565 [Spirochaetota bacterium]